MVITPLPDARPGILPLAASVKLDAIRDRAEELRLLTSATLDQMHQARDDVYRGRAEVQRLTHRSYERNGTSTPLPANDPEVMRVKAEADGAITRRTTFSSRYEDRSRQAQSVQQLVTRIEGWVADSASASLAFLPIEHAAPKLGKNEHLLDAIDRVRRRGRELAADRHRIESAPIFAAEAKAKARTYLEELAARARPDVFGLIERSGTVEWPRLADVPVQPLIGPNGTLLGMGGSVRDGLALAALLQRDAMLALLDREIGAVADDASAMTDADRAGRIAEIEGDILANERDEEALIMMAEADGREVSRRADADPRAVLDVETVALPVMQAAA